MDNQYQKSSQVLINRSGAVGTTTLLVLKVDSNMHMYN